MTDKLKPLARTIPDAELAQRLENIEGMLAELVRRKRTAARTGNRRSVTKLERDAAAIEAEGFEPTALQIEYVKRKLGV